MNRAPKKPEKTSSARMLAKLKESGLNAEDAKKMSLQPLSAAASVPLNLSRAGDGFLIPYFDLRGKKLPMFRYRYFDTEVTSGFTKGAKLNKYSQPLNTPVEIYLPQNIDWRTVVQDASVPLLLTEGELKAVCGSKYVMPTIGLGGVFSFGSRKQFQKLIPSLLEFKWEAREVFICYDSDAVTNKNVLLAEHRLAEALTDLSAQVRIVRIPHSSVKMGLDDYVMQYGKEGFEELLRDATLFAPAADLFKLNSEVLYVRHPSMVVEYPKSDHPDGQERFRTMLVSKFKDEVYAHYKTIMTNGAGKAVEFHAAKEWVQWPGRATVDSVVYSPGDPVIVNGKQLNLWEGWGGTPVKGDVSLYKKLLDYVFTGVDPALKKWFEQWVAYPIQHPGTKLNTAVVVWSLIQGSGKSLLGYTIGRMYGKNYSEVTKPNLSSTFNEWAVNKQFVVGEEITGGNSREVADLLKNMITGLEIRVNKKFEPSYVVQNCINYYFTSNHPDAFFLSAEDRRYFIHEITATKPPDSFFRQYDAWFKTQEATNALLDYFLNVDLTGFNPMAEAPHTASRKEMIDAGKSEHLAWASELRELPDNKLRMGDVVLPYALWTTEDLLALYQPDDVKRKYNVTAKTFAIALKEVGFKQLNGGHPVETVGGRRQRMWAIRPDPKFDKMKAPALTQHYNTERALRAGKKRYHK